MPFLSRATAAYIHFHGLFIISLSLSLPLSSHSIWLSVVLCVAMVVLIVFETIFGYMRRFLVLHITARADARLSTYMFNKVFNLPLDFFERSSTGLITRRISACRSWSPAFPSPHCPTQGGERRCKWSIRSVVALMCIKRR